MSYFKCYPFVTLFLVCTMEVYSPPSPYSPAFHLHLIIYVYLQEGEGGEGLKDKFPCM